MKNKLVQKSLLPKSWHLPEIFRERLGSDPGQQRIMAEEGQYLIILHQVPKAADKGERKAALFWVNENSEWKSSPETGGIQALAAHIESYQSVVKDLERLLDACQNDEMAEQLHHIYDEASPLLRASRHLLGVVQQLRELFPKDRLILTLRDNCVNIERSLELLLNDTKSTLDFLIVKSATIQAKEAHRTAIEANKLNRLAAFFFPVVTIAALLSLEDPVGTLARPSTYIILITGLLLGAFLLALLKRNSKTIS